MPRIEYPENSAEEQLQTALESIGMRSEEMLAWLNTPEPHPDGLQWIEERFPTKVERLARLFSALDHAIHEIVEPYTFVRRWPNG